MGTSGLKVYHSNDRYFVHKYSTDSYPSGLGLEMLHDIPRNASKKEFAEWVKSTEEYLEAQYEVLKNANSRFEEKFVTNRRPRSGDAEFVYEIDLDGLIFLVDGQPLFNLDNMPPDDVFLKGISYDHFGYRALYEHTPDQYRYDWRVPPPIPPPQSLIAYNSFPNRSSTTPIHELLGIPTTLSPIERSRMALVEVLMTRCMIEEDVGWNIRTQDNRSNRDEMLPVLKLAIMLLVRFAVGPQYLPPPAIWYLTQHGNIPDHTQDFIWIRKDVCLRITTHLDDQVNLRASMGDLIHHINTTHDKVGTIYGVACSLLHCAIVRVDKGAQDTSFAHTPALQFPPSFYARKMSTPGIEALSRLGCQASGVEFLTAISEYYDIPRINKDLLVTGSVAAKVPVEVWRKIGDFMSSPRDLVALASISPQALSAAADLARYPRVHNPWEQPTYYRWEALRLVDVVGTVSPIPETTESTDEEEIRTRYFRLGRRKFTASVEGGRLVDVELGQWVLYGNTKISGGSQKEPFDAQYLSPFAMLWDNTKLLYLSVLDHDKS